MLASRTWSSRPERTGGCLYAFHNNVGDDHIGPIDEHRKYLGLRDQFVEQLQSFRTNICVQRRYTGDVTLRPAQAFDKPCLNRIQAGLENNRNCCGCCLCREPRGGTSGRGDHGNLTANKISRQRGQSVGLTICPAEFDRDIATLIKAGRTEALAECGQTGRKKIRRFTAQDIR